MQMMDFVRILRTTRIVSLPIQRHGEEYVCGNLVWLIWLLVVLPIVFFVHVFRFFPMLCVFLFEVKEAAANFTASQHCRAYHMDRNLR